MELWPVSAGSPVSLREASSSESGTLLGGAGACGPLGACVAGGGRRAGAAGSLRPREWRVKN